jgi:hypothetical protein
MLTVGREVDLLMEKESRLPDRAGMIFAHKYAEMKLPDIVGGAKAGKDFYDGKE